MVEYTDDRQEPYRLDQLARFVTEEMNPGNRLGVARVTARLHTPLVDASVRLVDTPGVGSVHEHNTRSTDAYLPSLDAAVLVPRPTRQSREPSGRSCTGSWSMRCGCLWCSTRPTT